MKNWKYICIGIVLILGTLAVVSADPLLVIYTERYNVTANVSGEGITEYSINNLTGYLTINNTASNDTLSDVWVAINILNNISAPIVVNHSTPRGVEITDTAPNYTGLPPGLTYIHIPVLPNNSYVEIAIPLNKTITGVPIIINETYSATKVPANNRFTWNVTLEIKKNDTIIQPDVPVSVEVIKYLSNNISHYGSPYWIFMDIINANATDGNVVLWDGPYFTGNTNDALNWTNVTLDTNPAYLTFTVEAESRYTGRGAMKVNYGFAAVFFHFNGTVSGSTVEGVYAISDGEVSVCKKGPEKEESSGMYILWYENTTFKNRGSEYYYNLTKFEIWAVNGSNITKVINLNASIIPGSYHFGVINEILAPGEIWNSSTYNFTFEGVPVIWANYTFKIAESNITLLNITINEYSDEYGSSYIVIEKIYIVGSYLIKATKIIKTNPDGTYTIYIVVENIGGEKSPLVYVYDMVPKNFDIISSPTVERPYMLNNSGNQTLTDNDRYHLSLYWCLNPLNGGANGDGWYNDTELDENQTVLITYTVNGTGTFIPSDLFIVGIDPTHSLLPTTSPKMIVVGGSSGNNYEVLLALLTGLVGMILIVKRVRK